MGHLTGDVSTRGSLLTDALSRLCNGTILWLTQKITRRHPVFYLFYPSTVTQCACVAFSPFQTVPRESECCKHFLTSNSNRQAGVRKLQNLLEH